MTLIQSSEARHCTAVATPTAPVGGDSGDRVGIPVEIWYRTKERNSGGMAGLGEGGSECCEWVCPNPKPNPEK